MVLKELNKVLAKPYVSNSLRLFLILYASMAAPKLPMSIMKLFNNIIFKIVILFLVVYTGYNDPITALLIAVGFVVTIQALSKYEMIENFNIQDNSYNVACYPAEDGSCDKRKISKDAPYAVRALNYEAMKMKQMQCSDDRHLCNDLQFPDDGTKECFKGKKEHFNIGENKFNIKEMPDYNNDCGQEKISLSYIPNLDGSYHAPECHQDKIQDGLFLFKRKCNN